MKNQRQRKKMTRKNINEYKRELANKHFVEFFNVILINLMKIKGFLTSKKELQL